MFWIDAVLMLVCGWLGGTISTLVLRYVLEGQKPLDPKMLPASVPALSLPPLPPAPEFSPYAPKKAKPERKPPNTDALKRVWKAAKKERAAHWNEEPKPPKPPPPPRPPIPQPPPPLPAASTTLLPAIPWGA